MKSILIIEDDFHLNALYKKVLLKRGYLVRSANSIEQALELLKTFLPDYIILDLGLKDGHGSEVIDYLKQKKRGGVQPAVIVVSGSSHDRDVVHHTAHAEHVLMKPVSPRALVAFIDSLV